MSDIFVISKFLTVPHGFSTRHGGVSEGPFSSLNLGGNVGDTPEAVAANFTALAAAAGLPVDRLFTMSQVHGDGVLKVEGAPRGPGIPEGEADALWTESQRAWLGVKTADCVPILIQDAGGTRVAAVHSGWKGTVAEIVRRVVERLVCEGAEASGLRAAVGPSIQVCCYEVSAELAERFERQFGPGVVKGRKLDLTRAVRATLEAAGVPAENIDVLPRCTACEPGDFFSHRRDGGRTGRHLSFISTRS